MNIKQSDERFMKEALTLAKKAEGKTLSNPMVGAVIVKNKKLLHVDIITGLENHTPRLMPCKRRGNAPRARRST